MTFATDRSSLLPNALAGGYHRTSKRNPFFSRSIFLFPSDPIHIQLNSLRPIPFLPASAAMARRPLLSDAAGPRSGNLSHANIANATQDYSTVATSSESSLEDGEIRQGSIHERSRKRRRDSVRNGVADGDNDAEVHKRARQDSPERTDRRLRNRRQSQTQQTAPQARRSSTSQARNARDEQGRSELLAQHTPVLRPSQTNT